MLARIQTQLNRVYIINISMNKEAIIIPQNLMISDPNEKATTRPSQRDHLRLDLALYNFIIYVDVFDKLVSNDQLSYLPNLYLRQYRFIDELIRLRQDFPEQKLLLDRPRSKWDTFLQDAVFTSRIFQQRRKLKIATSSNLIRQARLQVQRTQLRAQEQYHFHRLICNSLGQNTVQFFKKTGEIVQPEMVEEKMQEKEEGTKKHQDDIFMNQQQYSYVPHEPDLLDDLLDVGGGQAPHMEAEIPQIVQIQPISTYVGAKYSARKEYIEAEPILATSRKGSLRRINENVRKRLKFKQEEQEQQTGRSLSSATVFLSSLLNTESQSRAAKISQPLNISQWLFVGERPRKKKDDEVLDLHWPAQELEKMQQRNQKNGVKKGKIDNGVLMLTLANSDQEYRKTFEKNIAGQKSFPPTLKSVPEAEPVRQKKYYNQFHDKQYESFVIKYNKKNLFQKFAEKASMIFPQNYSQDDVQDAQNISTGRLFIYKPQKLLKRVVFLKEERSVKTYLRSDPKNSIDEPRALLLAYLVEKYLRQFGNNWKNITQLICRHIAFAHIHITVQFVQQIYQIVRRLIESNYGNLPNLELWDKKILPYSSSYIQSYTSFAPNQSSLKMEQEQQQQKRQSKQNVSITPDYYKKLLDEDTDDTEDSNYHCFQKEFQKFLHPFIENLQKLKTNSNHLDDQAAKISKILEMYEQGEETIPYEPLDEYSSEQSLMRHQILTENLKGEIKVGTPYRKKKSINQRNNELVKILQALRNKTVPNTSSSLPKKLEQVKPIGPLPPQKINPPPQTQPKLATDIAAAQANDLKKAMKSPQKPDKKLGAPSKKDKKKDGQEKK